MNNPKILYVIIVVLALSGFLNLYRNTLDNEPFNTSLNPDPLFLMGDNLTCTVKQSSDKGDIRNTLSLLGLQTDNPKLLNNEMGGTFPLSKLYENDEALTLGLVASGTGSTDTFVLNKKTGEFARTSSGIFAGVYAFASKGICK